MLGRRESIDGGLYFHGRGLSMNDGFSENNVCDSFRSVKNKF